MCGEEVKLERRSWVGQGNFQWGGKGERGGRKREGERGERERERERDRQTDRQTERQRERDRGRGKPETQGATIQRQDRLLIILFQTTLT